jgi:type I restriction enzyme, S subunit
LDLKSKQIQEFKETEIGKIPADWEIKKINDLYEIRSGLSKPRDQFGFGYPFLSFKEIFENFSLPDKLENLVNSSEKERESGSIKRGDVFLTRTSETWEQLGMSSVALKDYENATFNGFAKRLRPINHEVILPEFAAYLFRSPKIQTQFSTYSNLTTRASLNGEAIKQVLLTIPTRKEQEKISKSLSDLTIKISNLQNQNHILEQMAQAIFQSWFVDFDGVTEWEDSELGMIPKGWSVKQIKDFCKVRRGASPRPVGDPKYFGGNIPWIKIADVSKSPSPYLFSTKETVTEEGAKKSVHLPKNSLIISNSGTVGKPIFLTRDGCIHDGWLYFENLIEISQEFLYFYLLTLTAHLNLMGDGTVQKNLNTTIVGEIKFVCPEKKYLDSFLKISQIILKTIKENQIKINTLTSLRDLLLPKLMSGEIRV